MPAWRIVAALTAVALVVVYAAGSGRWVGTGSTWYLALEQPAWQPPGWVFGLAWSYNFLAVAVVGVTMSVRAPGRQVGIFLAALAVTIALALLWAYLFYVPHSLAAAAIALSACALLTLIPLAGAFAESSWLGWVLVPYVAWLLIASSLSWGYLALNP